MDYFDKHFYIFWLLFDSLNPVFVKSCPNLPVCTGQPFSFAPFSVQEAHKPLKHSIIDNLQVPIQSHWI